MVKNKLGRWGKIIITAIKMTMINEMTVATRRLTREPLYTN